MENENVEVNENEEKIVNSVSTEEVKVKEEPKENSKRVKIIFSIVAAICIALYCAAVAPKVLQNDTYYTITIGEYIYNNGIRDLSTDMYSWHSLPYSYPHWLYDLGMYIIYSNFGHAGIYASSMILGSILGISIYTLCYKKSKNGPISLAITIGSCYILKNFLAARAQLVTFVLFAWTVLAIEGFLETKKKRYIAALIIIPLLIANLHCAVFPFYFVLYLPYIAEYLLVVIDDTDWDYRLYGLFLKIRRFFSRGEEKKEKVRRLQQKLWRNMYARRKKKKEFRENPYKIKATKNHVVLILMIIMIIAAATGCVNPAGNGAYTYLYKTMKGNTTSSINEHLPLTLVDNDEFSVAIIVLIIVLLFTDSKIKLSDFFMLAGITYLSFKSRRQVSMFAIFCTPIIASLLAQFVDKYDKINFEKIERFFAGWFGSIVIICLFVIWTTNLIKPKMQEEYVDDSSYPVEASDWMLANLDVKNIKIYNEYNYGSYLLFRGIPVFIDSRCDLYTPEFNGTYNKEQKCYSGRDIFSDAVNIANLGVSYKDKFDQYGVTHAILYSNSKLAMLLKNDSNYSKIYDQGNFCIFEKLDSEK